MQEASLPSLEAPITVRRTSSTPARARGGAGSWPSRSARCISWRPPSLYTWHALKHPWHLVVLAGVAALSVMHTSVVLAVLTLACVEGLALSVGRMRAFRRVVDQKLDQAAIALAAEQRSVLIAHMGEEHKAELAALEAIVDKARDVSRPYGMAADAVTDDCQNLLALFVRLSIVYNMSRQCLASIDRQRLEDEARNLEGLVSSTRGTTRELATGRLLLMRKRIERWDRSRETLATIALQLSMIADLVHLAHEQLAAPGNPRRITGEIDALARALDGDPATSDELAELLSAEPAVDPQVLELGRMGRG
jgi:hypothetical protein